MGIIVVHPTMSLRKIALDSVAEDYWEEYFGEYGKLWVRSIPRRVAAAVFPRTAAAQGRSAPPQQHVAIPLAHAVRDDGLHVEGIAVQGDQPTRRTRVFTAHFSHDGALISIDAIAAG